MKCSAPIAAFLVIFWSTSALANPCGSLFESAVLEVADFDGLMLQARKLTPWDYGRVVTVVDRSGQRENHPMSPEGVPFVARILGNEAAGWFGTFHGEINSVLPLVSTWIEGVRRYNQELESRSGNGAHPMKISARFVEVGSDVSHRKHLELFRDGIVPLARKGHMFLHDITYHLGLIFIPKKISVHGARLTGNALDLVDHLRSRFTELTTQERISLERMIEILSTRLDVSSGNFTRDLAKALQIGNYDENADLEQSILGLAYYGDDAATFLRRAFLETKRPDPNDGDKLKEVIRSERLRSAIEEYILHFSETDPQAHERLNLVEPGSVRATSDEPYQYVRMRRSELAKVIYRVREIQRFILSLPRDQRPTPFIP